MLNLIRLLFPIICFFLSIAIPAESKEIIVVGNIQLKPVSEILKALKKSLPNDVYIYSPKDFKEGAVTEKETELVMALGNDAINATLNIPESIPLVYGLVVSPPRTNRRNMTGIYIVTPEQEYINIISKYIPAITSVGIVYDRLRDDLPKANPGYIQLITYKVDNPYRFIESIGSMRGNVDAILLFPEKDLLTPTVMEKLFIFSFQERVPVMGVSEKHVKTGALLSLVFDEGNISNQMANLAKEVISRGSARTFYPSPPDSFNIFINIGTAKSMGIKIPNELLKKAKKVYQ